MTITPQSGWTPERVAELTRLWALGWSGGSIAKALGITRNSAIGKAHRLNLAGRPKKPPKPRAGNPADRKRVNRRYHKPPPMPLPLAKAVPEVPDTAVAPLMLKLMDLKPRSCRWPIGHPGQPDFGFCGHQSLAGRPYCSHHSALATTGVDRRRDAQIRAMVR